MLHGALNIAKLYFPMRFDVVDAAVKIFSSLSAQRKFEACTPRTEKLPSAKGLAKAPLFVWLQRGEPASSCATTRQHSLQFGHPRCMSLNLEGLKTFRRAVMKAIPDQPSEIHISGCCSGKVRSAQCLMVDLAH